MRGLWVRWAIVGVISVFIAGGCGDDDSGSQAQVEGESSVSEARVIGDFDPANFDNPTQVDNRWFPLEPGTSHVEEGTALEDDEIVERRIVTIITDVTKVINGVEAVVIWERDFNDDIMVESELAFFAQDNDGNVWHLGQYRETWDEDEFVGGRVWVLGLPDGAEAGIFMHAEPTVSSETYSQGFAPEPFSWTDRARVAEMGQEVCVAVDCYTDVLVTEEADEEDEGSQLKSYAPGVGPIATGFVGDDPEEEELELVAFDELDESEREEARQEALAMEERARMYSQLAPAS